MNTREMRKLEVGFTLLEVLIALVLFSVGILGVGALLIVLQKTSNSSYVQQEAVQYAYDIIDRMHANQATTLAGGYNIPLLGTPPPVAPPCLGFTCTPAQIATYDLSEWLTQLNTNLPKGTGTIKTLGVGNYTTVTVTVSWNDSLTQKTLGETVTPSTTYTLTAVL